MSQRVIGIKQDEFVGPDYEPYRPLFPYSKQYGWVWPDDSGEGQDVHIERVASIHRSNGTYHILKVSSTGGEVEIYVSPTGRIKVYRGKKELK